MTGQEVYGIYCSGTAGRVIKFFGNDANKEFAPRFVLYDGGSRMIYEKIKSLLPKANVHELDLGRYGPEAKRCPNTTFSDILYQIMADESCDKLLCFGARIFRKSIIDRFYGNLINFHPSILPAFPGKNAIDQAIANNAQILGNTAHVMDEGIDTGKIVVQTAMPVSDFKSYEDVLCLQLPMIKVVLKYCFGFTAIEEELIHEELKSLNENAIICYDKSGFLDFRFENESGIGD